MVVAVALTEVEVTKTLLVLKMQVVMMVKLLDHGVMEHLLVTTHLKDLQSTLLDVDLG